MNAIGKASSWMNVFAFCVSFPRRTKEPFGKGVFRKSPFSRVSRENLEILERPVSVEQPRGSDHPREILVSFWINGFSRDLVSETAPSIVTPSVA